MTDCDAQSVPACPRRPHVPVLLVCALALWACAAVAYLLLEGCAGAHAPILLVVAGALAVIAGGAALLVRRRSAFLVVLFAALGIVVGTSGALGVERAQAEVPGKEHSWTIELVQDMSRSEFSSYGRACATDEQGHTYKIDVFDSEKRMLLCKERFAGTIALSALKGTQRESAWQQGSCARVDLKDLEPIEAAFPYHLIIDARRSALESIQLHGRDSAGILSALVCGNRSLIQDDGTYEAYKSCGLAHLIAVSGAHLAIIAMMLGIVSRALRVPRALSIALCSIFLLAYLVFAGMPISGMRAVTMVLLSYSSWVFSRRAASLNACALCLIAFIAADPPVALSASLFLSAASTIGIILFMPLISSLLPGSAPLARSLVVDPLALTLSSNIVTLPYSMALFSQLPLISLVANIIAAPLFMLACISGVLATMLALIVPALAPLVYALASACAYPLDAAVDLLASLPYASIPVSFDVTMMLVVTGILVCVLWFSWPYLTRKRVLCASALCVLVVAFAVFSLRAPLGATDEVVMLDVGQGDSFLIRSGGRQILIDTGNKDNELREALGRYGVYDLDAVLVTHPDDDHCGSLPSLAGYVNIDRILISDVVASCGCEKCASFREEATRLRSAHGIRSLAVGDRIELGSMALMVLWPLEETDEGGNGDSLVVLLEADCDQDGSSDWRFLFTGDAEMDEIGMLCDSGACGNIDVLKVGHHGSRVCLDADLAALLDPEIALISVGAYNRYGHPSDEALEALAEADASVLRTDEEGCVELKYNASQIDVTTQNGRHLVLRK